VCETRWKRAISLPLCAGGCGVQVVCTKVREGKNRIVKLKEGDPAGKHVVIVTTLQSGSTLIRCQKVLAAEGGQRVSAFATHGVFPNRSWKRFVHDGGGEGDLRVGELGGEGGEGAGGARRRIMRVGQ